MNKKIAFFDFDGTITKKDSFLEFLIYYFGYNKFLFSLIKNIKTIFFYKIRLLSNEEAKEKLTEYFFKDIDFDEFKENADYFSKNIIDTFLKQKAIKKLKYHKNNNDKIVIVSASFECYLKKWCEKNGFELVATKLEVKNNKLSGKFLTKNCYGQEKVNRAKEKYNLDKFGDIFVYGDSKGDFEILKLAKEENRCYRCF